MHAQQRSLLKGDRLHGERVRIIQVRKISGRYRSVAVNSQAHEVEGAIDSVTDGIVRGTQATASVVKQGVDALERGANAVGDAYSKVSPAIEKAVQSVTPIIHDAVEGYGKPLASSLSSQLSKGTTQVISSARSLIEQAGVSQDTINDVERTASTAISFTKPLVSSAVEFVTETPPLTLFEYAGGVAAFALVSPTLTSLFLKSLRGYAGVVSPAISLDKVSTSSQVALIDIRSIREKEGSGIPDFRDKSKYIELEFASLDDPSVRRELKNIRSLEITMTALQIAALKKIAKSTEIYLMDKNGSVSGAVARQLSSKGFGKVYIIRGGFDAWQRQKLPIRMATSVSSVEVVAPGAVLFGSTRKSTKDGSTKKSLPGPSRKALPASTRNSKTN